MKRKEIKNLAKKIGTLELVIQNPDSSVEEKERAESEITRLSTSSIHTFEDMIALEEAR